MDRYDILIMARHDAEVSALSADALPEGDTGVFQFGDLFVNWRRLDWNDAPTPGGLGREKGHAQKAYLRTVEGFRILGRSEFVITDRLHGHIMSTVIGQPHVLLDSKLGKNLNLHNTWTSECDCTRIAETFEESIAFARLFFEKAYKEGRWSPSAGVVEAAKV
jgi:exopolysaccharide biosynthesis predicted pyruvyltransferase EpsI